MVVRAAREPSPREPQGPRAAGALAERYTALFTIGRGGMGSVGVALERRAGGFERIVALKRLLRDVTEVEKNREMFLHEARLAALLSHPNVVHAFAFGESDGELFLAMEYVEGEPLSKVLRKVRDQGKTLDPSVAAHLLAETCDGLHAAHELRDVGGHPLGLVHRDVSPHNVMVAFEGNVKLLDFGIAKVQTSELTRTGEVKGKMAYMSPEQAMGDAIDRRSDLFSVGAVLFECVAGQRLWADGTDMDILRRLALETPPMLRDVAPHAPDALSELCARLLTRNPADRPATARAVASELRRYLAGFAPNVDEASVRAVMTELFAEECAARRNALTQALESIAPSRVEELRRSIHSGVPALSPASAATVVEGNGAAAAAPTRGNAAAGLVGALALGLVIAGGVVVVRRGANEGRRDAPRANASTLMSTATPDAPSAPTQPAAASPSTVTSADAQTTATARTAASVREPPRAIVTTRAPPSPPTSTSAAPSASSAPSAPASAVDVDPNPF